MISLNFLYNGFHKLTKSFELYLFAYFLISITTSAIFVYINRPFTNPLLIKIIDCFLKFASIALIYISVSDNELFLMIFMGFFTVKFLYKLMNFKLAIFFNSKKSKRRFLTIEEYDSQSKEFTKKQLIELKNHCLRAECSPWRLMTILKNPGM